MSATGDQDPTKETRDKPETLEGEWVHEAAGWGEIGYESGPDATLAIEEIMAVRPRRVDNVGPEINQEEEGDRRETLGAQGDSDIQSGEEEGQEEEVENIRNHEMEDAQGFPTADYRFVFLEMIQAILNHIQYNDLVMIRHPSENDGVMETLGPSSSGHSSEVQVPSGPIPSTVRASEYEGLARSVPETISSFSELEEPPYFKEAEDHYLQVPYLCLWKPAVEASVKEQTEEMAAEATAEEPKKEVIEQTITSEGEHDSNACNDEYIFEEEEKEEEKGIEQKNQEARDEVSPDAADCSTGKSS